MAQGKLFSPNKTLRIGSRLLDLSVPRVMGILNVTPDSFYDGERFTDEKSQVEQVEKMVQEGVDIIDIGGQSTRPGATLLSADEEWTRIAPCIKSVLNSFPHAILSVDTFHAEVARRAIDSGVSIVNDITAGSDEKMFSTVAALRVPYVAMHMRGTPQTMTQLTDYDDLLKNIVDYFHPRIATLHQLGLTDILIDPGFGFAKTREQNFYLLKNLEALHILEKPLLIGLSRKSMIWKTLNITPAEALNGTTALNTVALLKGASILRVHDVRAAKEVIQLVTPLA